MTIVITIYGVSGVPEPLRARSLILMTTQLIVTSPFHSQIRKPRDVWCLSRGHTTSEYHRHLALITHSFLLNNMCKIELGVGVGGSEMPSLRWKLPGSLVSTAMGCKVRGHRGESQEGRGSCFRNLLLGALADGSGPGGPCRSHI